MSTSMKVGCIFLAGFLAGGGSIYAQSYGTINLPRSLCDSGVTVQRVTPATQKFTQWGEGPAVAQNGNLFFSEQNAGNIWKVTPAGVTTKLVNIGSYSNGLDFHPVDRNLVVCEAARITERDTGTGAVIKVITSGTTWGQGANDLTFATNGDLFFTCWNQHIFFHSNDSSVTMDWNYPTAVNCNWNGIEYIEEKGFIYACQYGQNRVVTFKVSPTTHMIDTSTIKQFGPTIYSPDGITVDSNYNVYVANNSGSGTYPNSIVVLDSSGNVLGSIKMTQATSSSAVNCVFGNSMFGGGPNPHTLYITGDSGAFQVQLKVAGRVHPGLTSVKPGSALVHPEPADRQASLLLLLGNRGNSWMHDLANPSILYNLNGRRIYLSQKPGSRNLIPGLSPAVLIGREQNP